MAAATASTATFFLQIACPQELGITQFTGFQGQSSVLQAGAFSHKPDKPPIFLIISRIAMDVLGNASGGGPVIDFPADPFTEKKIHFTAQTQSQTEEEVSLKKMNPKGGRFYCLNVRRNGRGALVGEMKELLPAEKDQASLALSFCEPYGPSLEITQNYLRLSEPDRRAFLSQTPEAIQNELEQTESALADVGKMRHTDATTHRYGQLAEKIRMLKQLLVTHQFFAIIP